MSLWSYVGIDQSEKAVKGKVHADDEESAKKRVADLGIRCQSVKEVGAIPKETTTAEQDLAAERTVASMNQAVKSFQETSQMGVGPKEAPKPKENKPRQYVLYGNGTQVQSQAEPFLVAGGRVIHAKMCPDGTGRPQVLLVIEEENS